MDSTCLSLLVLLLSSVDLLVKTATFGFVGFLKLRVLGLRCWSVEGTMMVLRAHGVCNNDSAGRLVMDESFQLDGCKLVMVDSVEVED